MRWLVPSVTFGVGFAVGLLVRAGSRLKLDPQVNVVEAANLILTVAVGFIVTHYLNERMSNRRVEKDLFIAEINDIRKLLQEVRDTFGQTFQGPPLDDSERGVIRRNLRSVANTFTRVEHLADRTKLPVPPTMCRRARGLYFEYKIVVTGDDRVPRRPYGVPLETQHENVYNQLAEELAFVMHEINRC
jgi:hypothetical protein